MCEKIKNSLMYPITVLCRSNGELQKLKDEFEKTKFLLLLLIKILKIAKLFCQRYMDIKDMKMHVFI